MNIIYHIDEDDSSYCEYNYIYYLIYKMEYGFGEYLIELLDSNLFEKTYLSFNEINLNLNNIENIYN